MDTIPAMAEHVPEVLFVCVHNAGRSQMAAALLARHGAGTVEVRSAGSEPAERLNPAVVAAIQADLISSANRWPHADADRWPRPNTASFRRYAGT